MFHAGMGLLCCRDLSLMCMSRTPARDDLLLEAIRLHGPTLHIRTLMAYSGLSERGTRYALRRLEDAGKIRVVRHNLPVPNDYFVV